ncbi:hypothetical protein CspHIS471_0500190 [Cutaneotrichosporon sp. HIS471]|nr:hypothetical protein CspHIS471_0500190 [Cutaneotrichosporon sp. HIS471]
MSRLDAQAFPHIWELIESYASHKLLLRLRLVDRASCVKATRSLFSHVEIRAQSRTTEGNPAFAFSFSNGPLPLQPPRMMGPVDLSEHTGWEDTLVLDARVNIRDVQPYLIGLEVVRRYPGVSLAPPAFTYVDVLRAPFVGRARVHPTGYLTERHVFVVLYDVAAPTDPTVHLTFPQAPAGEDAVFVFRSSVLVEPTPSRMPGSERAETFLRTILCFVAQSSHASYTLVGLEDVPPFTLALELGLDPDDIVHRAEVRPESWAAFVADHVVRHIHALGPHQDITMEHIRLLTMRDFRTEAGDEAWFRETMMDVDLAHLQGPVEL